MEYADDYSKHVLVNLLSHTGHFSRCQLINQQCIPSCWKSAVIVPVPKNQRPTEKNDFRPVALTSVVMKSLEKIVLHNLIQPIQERIDTCQFAYQRNKSLQDAVL